jgi:hypothetical protein
MQSALKQRCKCFVASAFGSASWPRHGIDAKVPASGLEAAASGTHRKGRVHSALRWGGATCSRRSRPRFS